MIIIRSTDHRQVHTCAPGCPKNKSNTHPNSPKFYNISPNPKSIPLRDPMMGICMQLINKTSHVLTNSVSNNRSSPPKPTCITRVAVLLHPILIINANSVLTCAHARKINSTMYNLSKYTPLIMVAIHEIHRIKKLIINQTKKQI